MNCLDGIFLSNELFGFFLLLRGEGEGRLYSCVYVYCGFHGADAVYAVQLASVRSA